MPSCAAIIRRSTVRRSCGWTATPAATVWRQASSPIWISAVQPAPPKTVWPRQCWPFCDRARHAAARHAGGGGKLSGSFGAALAVSCAHPGHPLHPLSCRAACPLHGASICRTWARASLPAAAAAAAPWSASPRTPPSDTADITPTIFPTMITLSITTAGDRPADLKKHAGDAIDAVVIGVGSGGTITGVAEYIRHGTAWCASWPWSLPVRRHLGGVHRSAQHCGHRPRLCAGELQPLCGGHRADRATQLMPRAPEVLFFDGVPARCTSAGATAGRRASDGMGKAKRPCASFAGRRTYE